MKNKWLKGSVKNIDSIFNNIDNVFSSTRVYNYGKKTGNSISKIIDSFVDFIVPKK